MNGPASGQTSAAPSPSRSNLERWVAGLVIALVLLACFLVMRPFISAFLWAIILSFSSWPIYRRVLTWVGNRRTLAACLLTLAMILVVLVPILIVGATLGNNIKDLTQATERWVAEGPPAPPAWLEKVPLVGHSAVQKWNTFAADASSFWGEVRRLIEPVSAWLLKIALLLASGFLQFALSVFIAFFLFRDGGHAAASADHIVERIGGEKGKQLLVLAGNTIRSVVYGILGTAFLQGLMIGIGLWIAGVPGAGILAFLTFFVSIIPMMGTAIVWLPAAIWLFHQGSTGWAIFMIIWGLGVNNLENLVKPMIISRGSDMPFLLIFFGVLGGAITFGFIGVFLGPTLLALGYSLWHAWTSSEAADPPPEKEPLARPAMAAR